MIQNSRGGPRMPILALMAVASLVVTGLAGCAPANTNTTYSGADIGRTASVSYGVIVSMRNVAVQGQSGGGFGTLGGAAAGGVAGSFIGRNDVRGNIIGAIGGAIIGGLAGSAIEGSVSSGSAVEFIIREDNGQTIAVVQTNEEAFRPGERVVLTRGARTRIARAGV
jgi:outer membrane lipoprotein SlyB